MKKIKYLLMILTISLLTGCVKFNVNMDIQKDKSMDFSVIYAMNKKLLESAESTNSDMLEEKDREELESQGYTVKEYDDGDMKGYTISKKVKNIDEVSTEKDTEYSLSGILEENSDSYLFKITKGLLKNTYKAKFSFNASDSGLDNNLGNMEDSSAPTTDTETNQDTDTSQDIETDSDFGDLDFSSLASSMDLSFNVTLPNAALSNNATSTDNGLKTLTWKLDSSGMDDIEFEFELYNMTTIYVGIGVLALFIILIIVIMLSAKKGKNKKDNQEVNVSSDTKVEEVKENPQTSSPSTLEPKVEVPQAPITFTPKEIKEETPQASPLASINVVPVNKVLQAEVKQEVPVAPEVNTSNSNQSSTLASFEPQIVPPVAPITPVVEPEKNITEEVKVVEPEVNTPVIQTPPATNQNQEDINKPKIEQLEDL